MLLIVLGAAIGVLAGYSLSWILNAVDAENPVNAIIRAGIGSAGMYLFSIAMDHLTAILTLRVRRRLKNELRAIIAKKLAQLPYDQFAAGDSGNYVSWLQNDAEQLYTDAFQALFDGIMYLFMAIFSLTVMTASSWILGAVCVAQFAISFFAPQIFNKRMAKAAARRSAALEKSTEGFKDTVMGTGILYLNNLRHRIPERIAADSDWAEQEMFCTERTTRRINAFTSSVTLVNQIVLLSAAAIASALGMAPVGIVMSVGNLCGQFFGGVQGFARSIMAIKSTKPLWEKFEAEPEKESANLPPIRKISMENLSFAYGDRQILQNRSFSFDMKGKYALIGESGSGKTTILKLLLSLLPGYEGRIMYDETEQKEIDPAALYDQIAYVDQQVYLFQDTLKFNLTLGADYTDAQIRKVIKACKLESLIQSLPQGLDSPIHENGKNLSGGQRQRIALARGMLRNVQTIILDEGTSALDEENARDIEEMLMENENLGVILITHHLNDEIKQKLTAVYEL